ncbi:MAG: tetratricopeptide repeat protein, partial [Ferruginibacter sp.]
MKYFLLLLILSVFYINSIAQTSLEKGNTCFNNKEYQCALNNFLITLDTKIYKAEEQYLLLYYIGKCYYKLKQYPKAIDYFNQSVTLKPSSIYNYYELGDTYYESKNYSLAVDNFKKAYDLSSTEFEKNDMCWWLGKSYFALKKFTQSINEYKKINTRELTFASTDAAIGDGFYNLYYYDSAMDYYKKAIPLLKTDETMSKSVPLFIGKCYSGLGNYEMAIKYINDVLEKDPKYGLAIWEKGIVFANKKDYLQAINWYKKALESYTDSSNSYTLCSNIIACYQNVKNYSEEFNWQQKRKLFSQNKYAEYLNMATIQYGRLKQPAAAEKICTEAISNYQLESAALQQKAKNEYLNLNSIAGKIALEKKDTIQALKYTELVLKSDVANYTANAIAGNIA